MTKQQSLNPSDTGRYTRQIRFAPFGEAGQQSISRGRAAVVGLGALGSVIAQHLVRSGVGYIRLIDRDIVEWSNLQRQMLYTEQDVLDLLPKAAAASAHLRNINSSIEIEAIVADLTASNAEELLTDVDIIVDGTDNFTVRYLLNDISIKHGIPWIYGGAVGSSGMTMTIIPQETPCYRCLFPSTPAAGAADSCETTGVLSPIVDIIASIQAGEAIKLLSGNKHALHGTLFQADFWHHSWMPVNISKSHNPSCPTCVEHKYSSLNEYDSSEHSNPHTASLCGRLTIQITPGTVQQLDLQELSIRLRSVGVIELNPFLLRIHISNEIIFILFPDGRALVQGTEDSIKARAIYANILGI
ncbi:MAG: ThiF family adenylyltransferase [Candidatus Pristimantibacillus sp.]